MPYGTAFFAAGYEKRDTGYYDTPDALVSSGGSSTNFREATRGKTAVEEYFIEINIPLLEGVPGAQELEVTLSARTSDYAANGMVGAASNSNDPLFQAIIPCCIHLGKFSYANCNLPNISLAVCDLLASIATLEFGLNKA